MPRNRPEQAEKVEGAEQHIIGKTRQLRRNQNCQDDHKEQQPVFAELKAREAVAGQRAHEDRQHGAGDREDSAVFHHFGEIQRTENCLKVVERVVLGYPHDRHIVHVPSLADRQTQHVNQRIENDKRHTQQKQEAHGAPRRTAQIGQGRGGGREAGVSFRGAFHPLAPFRRARVNRVTSPKITAMLPMMIRKYDRAMAAAYDF